MTFPAPLRASTSRLPLSVASSLRTSTSRPSFRFASTASAPSSSTSNPATVQDAEATLAKLRRAEATNRKNAGAVDMMAVSTPVLETLVEPPYSPAWLFRKGGVKYAQDRFGRYRQTRQFLNHMISNSGIAKQKGSNWVDSVIKSIQCLSPTFKASNMLAEAEAAYVTYNKAQAAADVPALRSVSTASALTAAQTVAKSGRGMSWELVRTVQPPKVISARMGRFDAKGEVEYAQVTVRFDTEQALTTHGRGGQTKQQRVVENILFERILPNRGGWKIKQRLESTTPDFLR